DFHVTGVQTCALPIFGVTLGAGLTATWSARARAGAKAVRVALYKAGGVHPAAFAAAKQLLEGREGFRLRVTVPEDIRRGALDERSEERRVGKECRYRW